MVVDRRLTDSLGWNEVSSLLVGPGQREIGMVCDGVAWCSV